MSLPSSSFVYVQNRDKKRNVGEKLLNLVKGLLNVDGMRSPQLTLTKENNTSSIERRWQQHYHQKIVSIYSYSSKGHRHCWLRIRRNKKETKRSGWEWRIGRKDHHLLSRGRQQKLIIVDEIVPFSIQKWTIHLQVQTTRRTFHKVTVSFSTLRIQ